ncbi:hypothetical protein JHK82_013754 [Glycine max]|uniref:Uncharacterized protein n=2 Tax=Glycine subgen. Soja TaxID=1462606 RepID=A0A0R0K6D3_SOYBN|nr:hypothetical protein JHK87_013668 [Glycine soja]KAG5041653.1 hypothetical protein JHK85_014129 [Glycine max]KAG5058770.1 hypothetical protein JHK86_013766 [Glycine max]KAG5155785.1 hypothetical protein JHK82_013754 [Glycine max]KAH1135871.1 hypothetical protein GYH30_013534 [Glycine max]
MGVAFIFLRKRKRAQGDCSREQRRRVIYCQVIWYLMLPTTWKIEIRFRLYALLKTENGVSGFREIKGAFE